MQRAFLAMYLRQTCVIALLALMLSNGSNAQRNSGGGSTTTTTAESCDMCGSSASYAEAIDDSGTHAKRTISTNGCPNHYAVCTGKGTGTCGVLGEEGTATEAFVQDYTFEIPAHPVIATSTDSTPECVTDSIGVALNGVPIYSGAVSDNCDILDVTDADAEWTSFDFCGGHGRCLGFDCTGDYHYHFPATCLETQIGKFSDGHSPMIGWSLDGFPVYGPFGPAGTYMAHAAQGCSGDYCLDDCSGLEMELPEVDQFKYRYYFNGPLSDLVSLPTDPKPAASDYPFAMKCYKGCTYADLSAGEARCTGGSTGVASGYTAVATAGVTDVFVSGPATAAGRMCSDSSAVTSPTEATAGTPTDAGESTPSSPTSSPSTSESSPATPTSASPYNHGATAFWVAAVTLSLAAVFLGL